MKTKIKKSLENYMKFKFMIGFIAYPLFVAILPFKTVLTPTLSILFALISLVPLGCYFNEIYIKKKMTYKERFDPKFKTGFLYYHFTLSIILIVKGTIYAYFGIAYIVLGILILIYTVYVLLTIVLWPARRKIAYFIKFNSPIYIGIIIGVITNRLGLKGHPLAPIIFGIPIFAIYFFMLKRIVLSFKQKSKYKDKTLTSIYLATVPIAFISMSILMLHSYYVTQTYYFILMLISTMLTYLLIVVLAFVTLRNENKRYFKKNWTIYLFFIPAAAFAIVFAYVPMLGILLAFKDYNIHLGTGPINAFFLSPWVGFEHFQKLFHTGDFVLALKNTLLISTFKIVFVFPLPIVLAILINEVKAKLFKSGVQTLVYLPHFISWAIVGGIFYGLLATHGPVNTFLVQLGLMDDAARIVWYNRPDLFQGVLVVSYAWKEVGYSAIVYLAAIVGIDPALYEAAKVDGANKLQQIWNITIPGLMPTIIMLFVLRLGYILEAGFDQVIVMANENVRDVSEIIGTYVFRIGVQGSEFSFATAVGLFNSVVALVMILLGNFVTKKFFNRGIW